MMKFFTAATFVLLLLSAPLMAQHRTQSAPPPTGIVHTITNDRHVSPQMGRDLWFQNIQNYTSTGDNYYNLYVTSPSSANIHIALAGGAEKVLPVKAGAVASFNIPLSYTMTKSSIVINQAIHVWSDSADICAYVMSHSDYTSDGIYVIPTIGWGKDYVVAAYNALFEGTGTYVFDEPSEIVIVADQDNTVCTITPSCDMRIEVSPRSCRTCIAHQKGVPFTENLNRGDCVQYETIEASDAENFDMTGTIIHSTKPVGVIGGSMCPNIPMGYPYCDHVCEMIPPVRTWSSTYYTAPFYPANSGKQFSTYLIIGSKANQVIDRFDPASGEKQFCVLGAQYDHLFADSLHTACRWTSDAPFLLVQYINSSTYPDGLNSQGDPAEVVINGVGQFTKTVVFQTAITIGNQSPYKNYVNLIVNNAAIASTTFDGKRITSLTRIAVDSLYTIFRASAVKAGAHTATSDSGVGVYVYGYGYDESYAWAGSVGTGTFESQDTALPVASFVGDSLTDRVMLSDTGSDASLLNYVRLDSVNNMSFKRDPSWVEGAGVKTSYYDEQVIDSTQPALLQISVFDMAGNLTQIVSKYVPNRATITPPLQDFGFALTSGISVIRYDTITNLGSGTYTINDLRLLHGDSTTGFSIDSAVLTPLAPGEKRLIKISYHPTLPGTTFDTIIFGDGFLDQRAVVTGSAATAGVDDASSTNTPARLTISDDGRTAHAVLPASWTKTIALRITDVRGVNVLTMSSNPSASLDFDVSSLTSGVYFYRLSSGNERVAGKIGVRK